MNTLEFMEDFIKAQIIKEFAAKMVLEENVRLHYVPKMSEPVLTFAYNEEHSKKFALTNVVYWDVKNLHGDKYTIDGLVINNGSIIITAYSITN